MDFSFVTLRRNANHYRGLFRGEELWATRGANVRRVRGRVRRGRSGVEREWRRGGEGDLLDLWGSRKGNSPVNVGSGTCPGIPSAESHRGRYPPSSPGSTLVLRSGALPPVATYPRRAFHSDRAFGTRVVRRAGRVPTFVSRPLPPASDDPVGHRRVESPVGQATRRVGVRKRSGTLFGSGYSSSGSRSEARRSNTPARRWTCS